MNFGPKACTHCGSNHWGLTEDVPFCSESCRDLHQLKEEVEGLRGALRDYEAILGKAEIDVRLAEDNEDDRDFIATDFYQAVLGFEYFNPTGVDVGSFVIVDPPGGSETQRAPALAAYLRDQKAKVASSPQTKGDTQ